MSYYFKGMGQKFLLRIILAVFACSAFISISLPLSPGPVGPYLDGIFPSSPPSTNGSWTAESISDEVKILSPVRILEFNSSDSLLILSKSGLIYLFIPKLNELDTLLNIVDRTYKLGDSGAVGVALHPKFFNSDQPDKTIFVYYKTNPYPEVWDSRGFNRLSKFYWDEDNSQFDETSEEILIQQYDRSPWHDGGSMFFGPDGFLYFGVGDEGYEEFQNDSNQKINGGFFSGIFRIDVDKDSLKSHPIRRQPMSNEPPPSSWEQSYSRQYYIPNDNPWQDENGEILEEYFAVGIRSPFTMHWDNTLNQIWVADVGSDVREEINLIESGDNGQWPFMEGSEPSSLHERPQQVIGNEKPVYFEYEREVGTCIIGGGVYEGIKFSSLNGKYLFADYSLNKLMALTSNGSNQQPEYEVLINNLSNLVSDLPHKAGITGVYPLSNGDILISVIGEDYAANGQILRLKQKAEVLEPPSRITDLGIFNSIEEFKLRDGLIPYDVNAPLWSDGAIKKRWISIPNDGSFDSDAEQIKFDETSFWEFPEGTVFIKHFELPVVENDSSTTIPLETRFFIIGEDDQAYGLTYKWNKDGTQAILQGGGSTQYYDIMDENGNFMYSQRWDFPSRDQCMTCHNRNAGFVLGVNTHQLNSEKLYPTLGQKRNQISYLNELNAFNSSVINPSRFYKSSAISDSGTDLEWRIRSYLDANCASCHRFGGVKESFIDLTLGPVNRLVDYYNYTVESHASTPGFDIIKPGDHSKSELWIRDASELENQMPPLGRNKVDQMYVDSLAKWIDGLEDTPLVIDHDLHIFPNPTNSWITLKIDQDWDAPFKVYFRSSSGRLLMQTTVEKHLNYLNLSEYPEGTYFLELVNSDNREARKIIIQR